MLILTIEDFRGAESKLYLKPWLNIQAVYKKRLAKKYRIDELDFHFRKQRTIFEARLLAKAKACGVRTPIIYEIDIKNTTLVMEHIKGKILKELIPELSNKKINMRSLEIGRNVGKLHSCGIIHGDLTTSNIILEENQDQLIFIDFGLGYISDRLEDFGIDLYLLQRSIESTHTTYFKEIWKAIMNGYKETSPCKDEIEEKISEIDSRGRYSERI